MILELVVLELFKETLEVGLLESEVRSHIIIHQSQETVFTKALAMVTDISIKNLIQHKSSLTFHPRFVSNICHLQMSYVQ